MTESTCSSEFEAGDMVVCVDDSPSGIDGIARLTKGATYQLVDASCLMPGYNRCLRLNRCLHLTRFLRLDGVDGVWAKRRFRQLTSLEAAEIKLTAARKDVELAEAEVNRLNLPPPITVVHEGIADVTNSYHAYIDGGGRTRLSLLDGANKDARIALLRFDGRRVRVTQTIEVCNGGESCTS